MLHIYKYLQLINNCLEIQSHCINNYLGTNRTEQYFISKCLLYPVYPFIF